MLWTTCNNVDDDATVRHDKINDWIKISELEVSKRVHTMYTKLVLYTIVMLSWVKEQMWMEKKSYKISSIIRHFNEHYISQFSMLIVLSICFSVKVFAMAVSRFWSNYLCVDILGTQFAFSPTLAGLRDLSEDTLSWANTNSALCFIDTLIINLKTNKKLISRTG